MDLPRSFAPVLPAAAATILFAACVNLTPPWAGLSGTGDAGVGAPTDGQAGGSGGAFGPDGASGGAGGSVATGGKTMGGTATGGTSGTATGGAAGSVAPETGTMAGSPADGGIDVPFSADSNTPADQATVGTRTGGSIAGGSTGTGMGGASTGGTSGTGMGGAGGTVVADAGTLADKASPPDGRMDTPSDISLPPDGSGGAGTGGTGGNGGTGGVVTDAAIAPMTISIDFVGGMPPGDSGITGTAVMAATESAGYKPATNWNSAAGNTGTLASLKLADGTTTSASVAWNSPLATNETSATWTLSFADAPGDVRMMNGYLDPRAIASPATVSVTGLAGPMSSGYDVYIYCFGEMTWADTRTFKYTIGSTTHTVTQKEPPLVTSFSGYTLAPEAGAGNYVVFRNVTGTSFTLKATPGSSLHQTVRAPVNGIQIVYPPGS